jgi:hypothetical protein
MIHQRHTSYHVGESVLLPDNAPPLTDHANYLAIDLHTAYLIHYGIGLYYTEDMS